MSPRRGGIAGADRATRDTPIGTPEEALTSDIPDPFDLQRFVAAQAATYQPALAELRAGRKRSHWMWFVFPQLAGLGHSATARHYGIKILDTHQIKGISQKKSWTPTK